MSNQLSLFDNEPVQKNQYGYAMTGSTGCQPVPKTKPASDVARTKARRTDPFTSQEAAEAICGKVTKYEYMFMNALISIGHPSTAYEVAAEAVPIDGSMPINRAIKLRDTLRKRSGELKRERFDKHGVRIRGPLIEEHGERPCRVNGSTAMTFDVITILETE